MDSIQFSSELSALSRLLERDMEDSTMHVAGDDTGFRLFCHELLAKVRDHVISERQAAANNNRAATTPDVREFGYL